MNEDELSLELQFDDFIDVKEAFKTPEDKSKSEELEQPITIDPMEDLRNAVKNSEKEEDKEEDKKVEVKEESEKEEDEDITEDQKATFQQVVDLREIGALFLPDEYEVETLEKAIQDSEVFRNKVAVNTVFESIPDAEIPGIGNAKDLFAYLYEHKGKSVEDFKNNFGVSSFDPAKFDLEKESDRKKILDIFFTEKGFTEVKKAKMIDKIFEDVEDEQEAKDALDELTTMSAKRRAEHLQELQEQEILKEREAQETFNALSGILEKNDIVGGFPIGKDEKPKALNSLYKQVNVGGKGMTDFNFRLNNVVLQQPELTIALSAFLNTLSQDEKGKVFFDLSKFERKEKTKAVRNLKEEVSRVISGKRKMTSSSNEDRRKDGFKWDSVVDYSELL